ncbi:MAG TPA: MarR family winged helix-turn-helix transcriptional regulator [Burkholderiales bacterium]|jgi:DNA-binding MarR family transcriptional regulator
MGLYRAETYRVEDSVGWLITRLRASIFAAVDREVAAWGVSAAQCSILLYIAAGRGDRAADIARDYDYDTGSMTRMVARLAAKRLLKRVRDAADRRVQRLELTAAGRKLAGEVPAVAVKVLNQHLRGFTRAELEQLKGFLQRMLENRA